MEIPTHPDDVLRPSRAIIVADADVLHYMLYRFPPYLQGHRGQTHARVMYDLMEYLGDIGFDIVIPEMVSYEICAATLRGNADDVFPKNKTHRHKAQGPMVREQHAFYQRLIERQNKNLPNHHIHILSAPSQLSQKNGDIYGGYRRFLDEFHDVFEQHVIPGPEATNAMIEVARQLRESKDLGDHACMELIETISQHSNTPVFFFSNDRRARDVIFDKLPHLDGSPLYGNLSLSALILACENTHLTEKAGLRFDGDRLRYFLQDAHRQCQDSERIVHGSGLSLVDANRVYHEGITFNGCGRPFYYLLETIAQEIAQTEKKKAETRESNPELTTQKSRVERFNERYTRRHHLTPTASEGRG